MDREVSIFRNVRHNISLLKSDMINFTKELISIETENPPGKNYKDCVTLLQNRLNSFNLKTRIIDIGPAAGHAFPRHGLIATWGEGRKIVYLHGHYDVVPCASRRQYQPFVSNGKIFGRGASDMKGGLTAMIYTVRLLQSCGFYPDGRVCLVIVPDEETGGKLGTEYLIKNGYIDNNNAVAMFMPEPTSGAVWNACRGAISLIVRVIGKPVHVTMQNQGVNAFDKMVQVVQELNKLKIKVEKRKTHLRLGYGETKSSILMLGGISGCGTNFNTLPGECYFSIERRINPEENFEYEKRSLFKTIEKCKRIADIRIKTLQDGKAVSMSSSCPAGRELAASIKQVTGKSPRFNMCPGLLEIRFYIDNGIPSFAYGPGTLAVAHSADEYVKVKNILDCMDIYARVIVRLLPDGSG